MHVRNAVKQFHMQIEKRIPIKLVIPVLWSGEYIKTTKSL